MSSCLFFFARLHPPGLMEELPTMEANQVHQPRAPASLVTRQRPTSKPTEANLELNRNL